MSYNIIELIRTSTYKLYNIIGLISRTYTSYNIIENIRSSTYKLCSVNSKSSTVKLVDPSRHSMSLYLFLQHLYTRVVQIQFSN